MNFVFGATIASHDVMGGLIESVLERNGNIANNYEGTVSLQRKSVSQRNILSKELNTLLRYVHTRNYWAQFHCKRGYLKATEEATAAVEEQQEEEGEEEAAGDEEYE